MTDRPPVNETRPPEMRSEPRPTEEHATPDQARQGFRGWPVLFVLIGGLVLGAIYILSMLLYANSEQANRAPPTQSSLPAIERSLAG